jgi:phage gp16-like protein
MGRIEKGGETFSGYNKPKRTPNHPTKSHAVLARSGGKEKLIRFGAQGVSGSPKKKGESESYRKRRQGWKARHRTNINKGPMSAAYWANKVKW